MSDLPRIPCLSLQQPYASALVCGTKDIENRGRCIVKVPEGGLWIAIAASATDYGRTKEDQYAVRERVRHLWPGMPQTYRLVHGAILGAVRFDWHVQYTSFDADAYYDADTDEETARRLLACRESVWSHVDSYCYHVAERRSLTRLIPAKGAMGLWTAPPDADAALRALVPEAWAAPVPA